MAGVVAFSCASPASPNALGPAATPAPQASTPVAVSAPATPRAPWRSAPPPAGPAAEPPPEGTRWIELDGFDGRPITAALYAPVGSTPASVVVYLHSDAGMLPRDLKFAASLAADGFVAIAPCWQGFIGAPSPRVYGCTHGALRRAAGADVAKDISAIADVARTLPGARADRLVVAGHSGGASAALLAGSMGAKVDAVVAIDAAYGGTSERWGTTVLEQIGGLTVPVLIVHGVEDQQATVTTIAAARAYESAARERGKKVETMYVEGAGHEFVFFGGLTQELRGRLVGFLRG